MALSAKSILIGTVVTSALTAISYGIWWGLTLLTRGTLFGEFRMFVNIIAIFAFLSLAEAILSRVFRDDTEPHP